jgi:predicted ribosome quality control (RQC) complex YloA/Tae2 family protein
VHIVNLSLIVGLFTSGLPAAVNESPTIKAVNDTLEQMSMQIEKAQLHNVAEPASVAITPATPAAAVEEKPAETKKAPESIITQPGEADLATHWNEFVKGCDSQEDAIKTALSKHQMKENVATEFRSDLTKIRAHIQAVKPKVKDIGFSQQLVISRDLGDLKAEVEYAIASFMHPHESIEAVKSKFLAELDEAIKAKRIAQGDVDKLNAEVKQQEDLLKSMRRSTEAFASKDQELIANNFAGLHIALQRRIQFSQDSIPLLDEQRKKVEEVLQNASSANTLDSVKCKQYTDSLAKIATRGNEATAKGPLSSSQIVGLAMELEGLDDIVQSQINSTNAQNKQ